MRSRKMSSPTPDMSSTSTQRQIERESDEFSAVVGESATMRHALHMARRVATTPLRALLLTGEAGTGKELVARCIHNAGMYSNAPFVSINCASIPAPLLGVELFGSSPSRHDGARKLGALELAGRGTLFLDEVGEIDPSTQVKLLRVMSEERAFERVGGNQTLRADVRLIAATNKNLEHLVREGKFRDDLYFRLNVVRVVMPPLRERKEDIPILVRGFLRHFCRENQKPLLELEPDAMDALLTYDWPGNIRELRTAIEHGVVMATGKRITLRDLPAAVRQVATAKLPGGVSPTEAFGEKTSPLDLHETERRLIAQALAATNGNVTAAAKKLGISRRTLHRKINEMNLAKKSTEAVDAT